MVRKLLIVFGIIVAHGALAAGLVSEDPPKQRIALGTCVKTPDVLPHIAPRRELLAMADIPIADLSVRPQ